MKITKLTILIVLLVAILSSGCIETGTGSSTDTIYGTETNGIIWKTYSVWLMHDNPSVSREKSYSAIYTVDKNDNRLIDQVEQAYKSKRLVKIYYRNEIFYEPWKYTSNAVAIIYKIEYV